MNASPLRRAAPLILCLLCLVAALGGCRLPQKSPPPRTWLLSPVAGAPDSDAFSLSLGVGPVDFPKYLDRREIIERVGPNELRANEYEVWGESLQTNFQDTLSYNISVLVPGLGVVGFPWKGPVQVDYRLSMVVSRFDHDVPSGAIVLEAAWGLRRVSGGESLARRTRTIREPVQGSGYAAITAAMSRAVETQSREIAMTLAKLPELHRAAP